MWNIDLRRNLCNKIAQVETVNYERQNQTSARPFDIQNWSHTILTPRLNVTGDEPNQTSKKPQY